MAAETPSTPPAQSGAEAAAKTPDLESLAHRLAAKHTTNGNPPAGLASAKRGGRRTAEQEVSGYLARHGLRAVPTTATPGDGQPQVVPVPGPAPTGPGYAVTPDFVKTCAETLLKGIEAFRQRQVYLTVTKLTEDKELAKQFAVEASAPPGAIDVMSMCAAELSQKYQFLATWSPEALLCLAGMTWLGKDLALAKRLQEIKATKEKGEAAVQPKAAMPEPAKN